MRLNPSSLHRARPGFTLVELLVTLAIIALLASILLPALSKSKEKAREITCANNLRQIGLAFHLYHCDNDDRFPAAHGGQLREDWVYYGAGAPGPLARSPIVQLLSGATTNILRCPSGARTQPAPAGSSSKYPFSYTLNDANSRLNPLQPIILQQLEIPFIASTAQSCQGMASAYEQGPSFHFRINMVRNPSLKIMLVEDDTASQVLGLMGGFNPTPGELDGSSWWPWEPVALRHGKRTLAFVADGHIEKFTESRAALQLHGFATHEPQ